MQAPSRDLHEYHMVAIGKVVFTQGMGENCHKQTIPWVSRILNLPRLKGGPMVAVVEAQADWPSRLAPLRAPRRRELPWDLSGIQAIPVRHQGTAEAITELNLWGQKSDELD